MQAVTASSFHLHRARILGSNMDSSLPEKFELVVVGTGLVESMVAAAAARNGHSVLHLDTASYYGGDWAAFTWEGLQGWIAGVLHQGNNTADVKLGELEQIVQLCNNNTIRNLQEKWHNQDEHKKDGEIGEGDCDPIEESSKEAETRWTKSEIEAQSRKFNLDLTPRLLFSRGPMVELLISSNISRYTEFKSVTRVLTLIQGQLEQVPSSRADVFNTRHISVVEKRILMKFLTHCLSLEIDEESEGSKPFLNFLKQNNLTDNLIHFIVHAIAMVDPTSTVSVGVASTRKFLSSLGRFGPTPFLWSMYGTGELPQAFCRLCAVFGGVYYLGRGLEGLVTADEKVNALSLEGGKKVGLDHLVIPSSRVPQSLQLDCNETLTSRGMFITTKSVLVTDKEQLTFISHPLKVVELSVGAAVCPRGLYVLHVWTDDLSLDLRQEMCDKLGIGDYLIYSLTYQMVGGGGMNTRLGNLFSAPGPCPELDFDLAIEQARSIFSNIFSGEEFLPRAPDPEEIIIGGEEIGDQVDQNDSNSNSNKETVGDKEGERGTEKEVVKEEMVTGGEGDSEV